MYFDRFDICEAYYIWLNDHHGGMGSGEYRRMCSMERYFKARDNLSYGTLGENAKAIYDALCHKANCKDCEG